MQVSVKTPTRVSCEKQVHTPPSIDRHDVVRPKIVKSISGGFFKRTRESRQNNSFDSSGLFVPASIASQGKRPIPKPLNLSWPISPLPSLRKASTVSSSTCTDSLSTSLHNDRMYCELESQIRLTPSVKIKNLEDFELSLDSDNSYDLNSGVSPRNGDQPIIWNETADDPYLEEGSPTYLCDISENILRVNSNAGHRRFVNCTCVLCDENMSSVLAGEKVIKLTCSHACHYECYLTMLGSLYFEKKYPQCRICCKVVKPTEEDILEEMVSNLLTKKGMLDIPNYTIEPQSVYSRLLSEASSHEIFTPRGQLIKTADVSCDGLKTPFHSCDPGDEPRYLKHEDFFEEESEDDDRGFPRHLKIDSGLENLSVDDLRLDALRVDNQNDLKAENKQLAPKVEIIKNHSTKVSSCSMIVKTLPDGSKLAPDVLSEVESGAANGVTQFLREQIEDFIKQDVDPDNEFGSLIIFDQIDYSTNGEQWIEKIVAYFFSDTIILFDISEMNIVGKIPVKQICQVVKLNQNVLIVDLKSTTLPEVYLSLPSLDDKQCLIDKWKYYMSGGIGMSHLEDITSTSWHILPIEMQDEMKTLQEFFRNHLTSNAFSRPWECGSSGVPLQLILCLNITNHRTTDQTEFRNNLKIILNTLNDDDLLGLVIVGRDGKGDIGEYGTYTGTMSKKWDCWKDLFDSVKLTTTKVFSSEEKELDTIFETCYRLISTSETSFEEAELSMFLKQIVVFRDSTLLNHHSAHAGIIENRYKFNILQIPSFFDAAVENSSSGGCVVDVVNFISALHNKNIKDLKVNLGDREVLFGDMEDGEEKIVSLGTFAAGGPFKNHEYEVEWFDRKKQVNQSFKGTLRISDPGPVISALRPTSTSMTASGSVLRLINKAVHDSRISMNFKHKVERASTMGIPSS